MRCVCVCMWRFEHGTNPCVPAAVAAQAVERVLARWSYVLPVAATADEHPGPDYYELEGFAGVFVGIKARARDGAALVF